MMLRYMKNQTAYQDRLNALRKQKSDKLGGLNVDTAHSMVLETVPANARSDPTDPKQLVTRVVNGVHPGMAGQALIADALWAWLKFVTSF